MRTLTSSVIVGTAVALALAVPIPAGAATGCDRGHVCFYEHADYGGRHFETTTANEKWSYWGNIYAIRVMNDRDSAVVNYWNTYAVTWYRDSFFRNKIRCLNKGRLLRTYADQDQGSSHRAVSTTC